MASIAEKATLRTKTSRFDITFFSGRRVRVGVSERSTSADTEILVQTPLLRTRQTRLRRIVWEIKMED